MMIQITERSAMYLEFLAGAFLQETGLRASEAELVQEIGFDNKVRWYFRRRENLAQSNTASTATGERRPGA
jgi:hypothetical protein